MVSVHETFEKLNFGHCEAHVRRGNLFDNRWLMRLLHGVYTERSERVRNDKLDVFQGSLHVTERAELSKFYSSLLTFDLLPFTFYLLPITSRLTTDFHCHLLPALDDGPTTMDESIQMALALRKVGFTTIYCTPHLCKGCFEADNEAVRLAVSTLQKKLNAEHIDLMLLPGREYHLDEFLFDYLKDPLPLGETRLIMIEIPNQIPVQFVKETCYQIKRSGFIPLLAHPERCALFAIPKKQPHISFSQLLTGNPKSNTPLNTLITYLLEIGCAFQANLGSFTSYYGQQVRQTAAWLKKNEVYTHFGTDLHTPEGIAYLNP